MNGDTVLLALSATPDGGIHIAGIPGDACTLCFHVNGVLVHMHACCHQSADGNEAVVPVSALLEDSHTAAGLPVSSACLLSCSAVDAEGSSVRAAGTMRLTIDTARRALLGTRRAGARAGDGDRILASAVQNPGESHAWEIPLRDLHRSANAPGADAGALEGFVMVFARIAFSGNRAAAVGTPVAPGAVVRWKVLPAPTGGAETTNDGDCVCGGQVCVHGEAPDANIAACVPVAVVALGVLCLAIETPPSAPFGTAAIADGKPLSYSVQGCCSEGGYKYPTYGSRGDIGGGKRLAVISSVSYYQRKQRAISNLEYCDEDAGNWYKALKSLGYSIVLYGDEHNHYPRWDGPATVRNVRAALRKMARDAAGPNDRIAFVASSHGAGDGRGSSFLQILEDPAVGQDASERSGRYYDRDIAADLSVTRARTFVFLDACFSGGIIGELLRDLPGGVVGTTTCSRKGYGYDDSSSQSGAWTNEFLTRGLAPRLSRETSVDLGSLFTAARARYIQRFPKAGDRPAFFGRTPDNRVRVDTEADPGSAPPERVFMASDWLC